MKQNLKVALATAMIAGGFGAYALTTGVSSLTPAAKNQAPAAKPAAATALISYSFDDADSPAITAPARGNLDYSHTSVVTGTTFLNVWGENNTNYAANVPLADDLSDYLWQLDYYWAGYGGCNGKAGSTILAAGETELFKISDPANWNSTMTLTVGSFAQELSVYPCNKANRISANTGDALNTAGNWYHFSISGSEAGVYLQVMLGDSVVIGDIQLSETNVTPTNLALTPGSCAAVAIDELELSVKAAPTISTVGSFSFDDAESPALTVGNNSTANYDFTSVVTGTTFLNLWGANNTTTSTELVINSDDLTDYEGWVIEYYWAGYGGCNKRAGATALYAEETVLYSIDDEANWNSTMPLTFGETSVALAVAPCNKATRISANVANDYNKAEYWYKFTVAGSENGVTLTVTLGDSVIVDDEEISAVNVNPTKLAFSPGSCGGIGLDELTIKVASSEEIIQNPEFTVVGETYTSNLVTLATKTAGAEIYYVIGEDTVPVLYTEPIRVYETTTFNAMAVKGEKTSALVSKTVHAGEIATPTAAIIKVDGINRTVVMGDATPDATIYYGETAYVDTMVINETLACDVVAKLKDAYTDTIFASAPLAINFEAGVEVPCAAPTFIKGVYDEESGLTPLCITADQSAVLCTPTAAITYIDVTGAESAYTVGDTLYSAVGVVKAYATAEGYAKSAVTEFSVEAPLVLNEVWSFDFKTTAMECGLAEGTNNDVVLSADPTFSVNGVALCQVTVYEGITVDARFGVQQGTKWLFRNQAGGNTGLYQFNSGGRAIGVSSLKAGQVLKIATSGNSCLSLNTTSILSLNAAQTTTETLVYDVIADGNASWQMTRYFNVWNVGVYNNAANVLCPDLAIAGYSGVYPKVALTCETEGADIYYAVSYQDTIVVADMNGADSLTFEMQPYSEFQKYEAPVLLNGAAKLQYYSQKGEKQSHIDESALIELAPEILAPVANVVAEGGEVKVTLTDVNPASVAAKLYVLAPAAQEWEAVAGTYTADAAAYGWYEFKAVAEGIGESAENTFVYVDARESYANPYAAVVGEVAALPVGAADVEYAQDAIVTGAYPTEDVAISGVQYFHKTVHANYNGLVLPFAFTPGTSVVTDAAGNVLTYGDDYKIYKFGKLNTTAIAVSSAANLLTEANGNAEDCLVAEGTGITANSKVYLVPADQYIGQDLVFQSAPGLALPVAQIANFTLGTTYRIIANQQFAEYALPNNAYVISEDGTQLECVAAGTILAPFEIAIQIKDAVVGSTIALGGNSFVGLETIETKAEAAPAFDLNGRAAGKEAKGLLIQGNKVIFK